MITHLSSNSNCVIESVQPNILNGQAECIRYDLPPSDVLKKTTPEVTKVEVNSLDNGNGEKISNETEQQSVIDIKSVNNNDSHQSDVAKDISESIETTNAENQSTSESSKSLLEEINDISKSSSSVSPALQPPTFDRNVEDYVDSREVEEYLEQLKEEQDNYVDEKQVEQYLKELSLEKSEQELLDKVTDAREDDEQVAMNSEETTEVHESSDYVSDEDTIISDIGTRPKTSTLVEEEQFNDHEIPAQSLLDIDAISSDLEPTISQTTSETIEQSDNVSVNNTPYVEEAEYVDLDSLDKDLEPQIGVMEDSNVEADGSPPPYSEVDPMAMVRPTSLDLSSNNDEETGGGSEVILGAPGATPNNPNGPRGQSSALAGLSEDQLLLGRVQPYWIPDSEAPNCMICGIK